MHISRRLPRPLPDRRPDRLRQRFRLLRRDGGADEAHAAQRQARQSVGGAEDAQALADHALRQNSRRKPRAHHRADRGVVLGDEQRAHALAPPLQRLVRDPAPDAGRASERQRDRLARGRLEALARPPSAAAPRG